jgi:DNA-binding IclR family transcriptional regulator
MVSRVRERGIAIDREEFAQRTMCIAAPVRNYEGVVIAAVICGGTRPKGRNPHGQSLGQRDFE